MPYPYGMQSAPAVGNGLGGLPRRQAAGSAPKIVDKVFDGTVSDRVFLIPRGYSFFRVTLYGAGYAVRGGGGGGCAQSAIYSAVPGLEIKYRLAPGTQVLDSTCTFKDVSLICTTPNTGAPGPASGGVINFPGGRGTGGTGTSDRAGGAATPNGPGGDAVSGTSDGEGGDGPGGPGQGNSKTPAAGNNGPSMVRIELF